MKIPNRTNTNNCEELANPMRNKAPAPGNRRWKNCSGFSVFLYTPAIKAPPILPID